MASNDETEERRVVSEVKTMDSRREHGLLGELRSGDPDERRRITLQLTGASCVLAAGAYGYIAASFGSEYPEYGWVFTLLGLGIGAGVAGMFSLAGGDDDGE